MSQENQARALNSQKPSGACTGEMHEGHAHRHGPNCGHKVVKHDDHVDYVHDGHYHRVHLDHIDECSGPN